VIGLHLLHSLHTGHAVRLGDVPRQLAQVLEGTDGSVGVLVVDELQSLLVGNGQRGGRFLEREINSREGRKGGGLTVKGVESGLRPCLRLLEYFLILILLRRVSHSTDQASQTMQRK
jgi:hypothetical protein